MGFWNRQTTVETAVAEQRFVIEVGHNRNNDLIIKKLRVSGDDLETCISDLQLALQDFKLLQAEGGMQKWSDPRWITSSEQNGLSGYQQKKGCFYKKSRMWNNTLQRTRIEAHFWIDAHRRAKCYRRRCLRSKNLRRKHHASILGVWGKGSQHANPLCLSKSPTLERRISKTDKNTFEIIHTLIGWSLRSSPTKKRRSHIPSPPIRGEDHPIGVIGKAKPYGLVRS